MLRENEPFLSVDWPEQSGEKELAKQLEEVVKNLRGRGRDVKSLHRLARLHVGNTDLLVSTTLGVSLSFLGLGKKKRDTYAGIFDIPLDEKENEKIALKLVALSKGNLHVPPGV